MHDIDYYIGSCNPYKMRQSKVIFNVNSSNMLGYQYSVKSDSGDDITIAYLRVYDDLEYYNRLLICVFSEMRGKYV